MKRIVVILLVLLSAAIALAQPAPGVDRREKVKQKVRALRAYTLTEQLELDEATAAKLFPALAKYDDEFDKLLQARADLQRRLEEAGTLKDAKAIDRLVDEAVANQRAIWDTETKRLEQLRKILTPAQVARTLIVLPAMERRIQNQLRRAVQKKSAQPRAGAPAASGDTVKDPFAGPTGANDDARFDKRDHDSTVNPFDSPRPAPKQKRQPRPSNQTCDPFGSLHGCK